MFKTQWYKEELQNSDSDIKHRSLSEEYSFFEAVKDGNIEFVQKNCQEKAFINQSEISFCYYRGTDYTLLYRRRYGNRTGLPFE